jgi:hypothetical protein
MTTRNEQAAELFKEIVDAILKGDVDLIAALRKGRHACTLANWPEAQTWFEQELFGFGSSVDLPGYRQEIHGQKEWAPATVYDTAAFAARRMSRGEKEMPQAATTDLRHPMSDIVGWEADGLTIRLSEFREQRGGYGTFNEMRVIKYPASVFRRVRLAAENWLFQFASDASVALSYGDSLETVWEGCRSSVEPVIMKLHLSHSFEAIRDGVASDNAQDWRNAMWACRDILRDVAGHVWQDPRTTYSGIRVSDKPMVVDEKHYINRLAAYLHFKGETGTSGKYLRSELERINGSLHALNELDSEAHSPVTRQDARLVAIGTYLLLGELIARTDMKPVTATSNQQPGE